MKNDMVDLSGMKTLCDHMLVDPKELKLEPTYQRCIEPSRKRGIAQSMVTTGYWPEETIIVNQDFEIVDGQHRVVAALQVGIKQVPISVVEFKDKRTEATYFSLKNNWNTSLKPVDFWYARYQFCHPYATCIYELDIDDDSLLKNNIALKGRETKKAKFTITDCCLFINFAVGYNQNWSKEKDAFLTKRVVNLGYEPIKEEINDFIDCFYSIFGNSKRSNPFAYRASSIRSFITFYSLAKRQDFLSSRRKLNEFIGKMATYALTADFLKANHAGRIQMLITHFNHKRTHRMTYDPFC